ncbi:hypothetical protein PR048_021970 [Dryococelus australis]|uniref:Uncharacterized protein n=1 Tax=Dryococelus australis TaxID=614101 RepID=A0ABQ9GZP8_9NEOP|nr:hypothetical protein PR048_021970 [Dryococelus australis]
MEVYKEIIDKLEGPSNWMDWKFQVKIQLQVHGCMNAVEVKIIPLTDEPDKTSAQIMKKHEEKMLLEKAEFIDQHIIVCSLSNQVRQLVNMCTSAKEMWDKLHCVYEQRTEQQQDRLFNQFFSIREKDPCNAVAKHIAKLENCGLSYKMRPGRTIKQNWQIHFS